MRDPEGRLTFVGDRAVRRLTNPVLPPRFFLNSPVAGALVDDGLLVPFQITPSGQIESPRYGFITHPTEWSDLQHHDAARLTLTVAQRVLKDGYELKDASAWNIIFEGSQPRFCDHLSFQPLASREWWAFGQFCRHFIFPLAGARWRGTRTSAAFRVYRDGIPAEDARRMFGARGLASRLLPLLWTPAESAPSEAPVHAVVVDRDKSLHSSLIEYAQRSLIKPLVGSDATRTGHWANYVDDRPHYVEPAARAKHDQVRKWLIAMKPTCVLDLGCNTGEFSRLALEVAPRVIAVDSDHDCVQQLYLAAKGDSRLHPVLADLGDLHGGRGWNADEAPGLLERLQGQADMALMLALIHHLHCSEGIPLAEIAALAARVTSRDLIVELLEPEDEMVQKLARQRRRSLDAFSLDRQLAAFGERFDIVERQPLPGSGRHLALMRLRS